MKKPQKKNREATVSTEKRSFGDLVKINILTIIFAVYVLIVFIGILFLSGNLI